MLSMRARVFKELEPSARAKRGLSPLNRFIAVVILVSVATAIAESEPTIHSGNEALFTGIEIVIGLIFLVEYMIRLWVCVENPAFADGLRGRLRYLVSATAILDLLALSPLFLAVVGVDPYLLRLFRLMRILRLAKLGGYSHALSAISEAINSRRYELATSLCIAFLLLLGASTLMYLVEGRLQPETFGSIPRAMWWAIATLTTVGYGDVYPITPVGRMLAGLTAIAGIGLIAMPTGIVAAAFSDAIRHRHQSTDGVARDRATASDPGSKP